MGYLLHVHAADLDAITDQLAHPSMSPVDLSTGLRNDLDPEVIEHWDVLADTIAAAVTSGGGTPQGRLAHYVTAVIAHHGHEYATLHHSSAGGDAFRNDTMAGAVADHLGDDTARWLLHRPLAGLSGDGHPLWGHLTTDEVAELAARAVTVDGDARNARAVNDLTAAITRAADFDLAIVTTYL